MAAGRGTGSLALLAPETRAVLDAYAAGVNAWLDTHRDKLGLAFVATGADPEPWTPLDTLAWGKVQAWNLGGNMTSELFRYLADARLGDPARTDELSPKREGSPVIVSADGGGEGHRSTENRRPKRKSPSLRAPRARRSPATNSQPGRTSAGVPMRRPPWPVSTRRTVD